jgi:hypothetical protein
MRQWNQLLLMILEAELCSHVDGCICPLSVTHGVLRDSGWSGKCNLIKKKKWKCLMKVTIHITLCFISYHAVRFYLLRCFS